MARGKRPTRELYHAGSENLREHGHPDVVVPWNPQRVHGSLATDLLEALCDMVAEGTRFAAGETIQYGYRTLHIRPGEEIGEPGKLALFEPALSVGPEDRDVDDGDLLPGVTFALLARAAQRAVADSLGLELSFAQVPSQRDEIECCDRVLSARELILIREGGAEDGRSGWFIGCHDGDEHDHPTNREARSGWQITLERPGLIPLLGLPVGCIAIVRSDGSVAVCDADDTDLAIDPGSYLDRHGARSPFDLPDILE